MREKNSDGKSKKGKVNAGGLKVHDLVVKRKAI